MTTRRRHVWGWSTVHLGGVGRPFPMLLRDRHGGMFHPALMPVTFASPASTPFRRSLEPGNNVGGRRVAASRMRTTTALL
jgi:hypothetical protein